MTLEEYLGGEKCIKANCAVCGKVMNIKSTTNNVVFSSEGIPQHKACIRGDSHFQELKMAILNAYSYKPANDEVKNRGLNWLHITKQIEGFLEQGFSTEEQLYCFEQCIKRDGVFWGYGRLTKFIDSDVMKFRKYKEFTDKQEAKKIAKDEDTIFIRQYKNGVVGGYGLINGKFEEDEEEN